MAHQEVATACIGEPRLQELPVLFAACRKSIDAEQMSVHRQAGGGRQATQCASAEQGDESGLPLVSPSDR